MLKDIFFRAHGADEHYKIWHKTERNMIILMHSNGGSIVCNEKTFPICRGAVCFVGSDVYHYTMPDEPSKYVRSKIFVTDEELRAILSVFSEAGDAQALFGSEALVYAQLDDSEYSDAERLFGDVCSHSENGKQNVSFVRLSAFMRLLAYIEENRIESISHGTSFLDRAINYINAHITDELDIEKICVAAHVSKYHFCREFKKRTGQTVMEYVLATRIVLAKNMLAKTDEGIGEISERCGFSSISYFCRVFKNDTGKTPLGFRKSINRN